VVVAEAASFAADSTAADADGAAAPVAAVSASAGAGIMCHAPMTQRFSPRACSGGVAVAVISRVGAEGGAFPWGNVHAGCGSSNLAGGATGWLTTTGNVVPGEIITVRIAIWDTSDEDLDSLALIDAFTWSAEGSDPGTVIERTIEPIQPVSAATGLAIPSAND